MAVNKIRTFAVHPDQIRSLALPAGMQVLRICREQNSAMPLTFCRTSCTNTLFGIHATALYRTSCT